MRRARLLPGLLLGLLAAAPACRAGYSFRVPEVKCDVFIEEDGSLRVRYAFTFECMPGARAIDSLRSDSRVLILETDSTQPGFRDLANNKIPSWLERKVGCPLEFTRSRAEQLRESLDHFDLVVHCGGYELDKKQMDYRIKSIAAMGTPVVTLGILIAHLHGLLDRITCFLIAEEIRTE